MHYAAKTRNPLKFAGVPQTRQQISAVSGPKSTLTCVGGIAVSQFFRLSIHALVATIQPDKVVQVQWCRDGDFWRFLRPVFSASRVQYISDLYSKFVLVSWSLSSLFSTNMAISETKIRTKATPCVEVWYTSSLRPLRLGEQKNNKKERKNRTKI